MATTPPDDKIRRILSLDGGGIYGLAEALWLKELCSICPTFLDGEDVDLFAGCSSGAINALLLAMYEEPREAVLKGVLESFWTDAGTFRNSDPIGSITSLFGLSPWFSEQDFLRQLERHFGSTTFAQLKHNVLISAYSWTGGAVSFSSRTSEVAWPFSIFTPEVMRNGLPGGESWGPKYFQNYRDSSCMDYRVVDVAYGAATPPGFRKIRAGIGDGASFTANPAVAAIADARYLDLHEATTKERPPAPPSTLPEGSLLRPNPFAGFRNLFDTSKQALDAVKDRRHVESTAVLSIGSGQYMPAYWSRDIDLGFLTFPIMPTNPAWGVWYSPVAYALDPATKGDEYVCWTLLGRRFHRLNPAVLSLPTVVAAFAAR
ncbi:MAG TPA: patatin-like phospholipase family protein, partial [Myxococcaceae bacterium]|nr:patatin-like phospholipase family protein [Myxococcaceae bacterium]